MNKDYVGLHVGPDGCVWFGTGAFTGASTHMPVQVFLTSAGRGVDSLLGAPSLRVLGTRTNAALLSGLYERREGRSACREQTIYVGSPAGMPACRYAGVSPEHVLNYLWQPSPIVPGGALHRMGAAEYATYAMLTAGGSSERLAINIDVLCHAAKHPAWAAITFLQSADATAACRLIADIVDPRHFRHAVHPTRLSRLYAWLGLTPKVVDAYFTHTPVGPAGRRASNAIQVWHNDRTNGTLAWRPVAEFMAIKPGTRTLDVTREMLRATQRMVSLIVHVWLCGLNTAKQADPVGFDPQLFFREPRLAKMYSDHALMTGGIV
jgi:hypothetical protein